MGSRNATVDGQTVQLTAAPQTVHGSTMIPLGFFGQQFGATVNWNQGTRTVSITSPREAMYTVGFYALSSFDQNPKYRILTQLPSAGVELIRTDNLRQTAKNTNGLKPLEP